MLRIGLFLIYPMVCSSVCSSAFEVKVNAVSGNYIGLKKIENDLEYYTFLGVKFANVVERFKEAVPVAESNDNFNAFNFGPACFQNNTYKYVFNMSEDCLYLDIYTPSLTESLPVIVFIYGGSFYQGSSQLYGGEYFMESKKVVAITIAYRVDAFGFLYLDDDKYPANLGIRDQILALKWIQNNIRYFGGDPSRVTITGQSAGGVSVEILMHSQLAKGLFVGAISQSGTSCSRWGLQPRCTGIQRRNLLGKNVGCAQFLPKYAGDAENFAKCLQNKTVQEILNATQDFPFYFHGTLYPPVVEEFFFSNPVITKFPYDIEDNSTYLVPWITGVNSNEAYEIIAGFPLTKSAIFRSMAQIFSGFYLADFLFYRYTAIFPLYVTEALRIHYFKLFYSRFTEFTNQIANNGFFYYPMSKCLRSIRSPTYAYYFDYRLPDQMGAGVPHCGELQFNWNSSSLIRANSSSKDAIFSRHFVNTWIDFAYNQNANFGDVTWEKYDPETENVLIIDNNGVRMGINPNKENNTFWEHLRLDDFPKTFLCDLF